MTDTKGADFTDFWYYFKIDGYQTSFTYLQMIANSHKMLKLRKSKIFPTFLLIIIMELSSEIDKQKCILNLAHLRAQREIWGEKKGGGYINVLGSCRVTWFYHNPTRLPHQSSWLFFLWGRGGRKIGLTFILFLLFTRFWSDYF